MVVTERDPLPRHRSPLALYLLLGYTLLILYASLSPFTGWRDAGIAMMSFVTEPLPRFVSKFDLAINTLAYIPFGFLATLVFMPVVRPFAAAIAGIGAGIALSFALETAQGFLPGRISNNLDLIANTFGTLAGVLLCVRAGTRTVAMDRLLRWRMRWFLPGRLTDLGLALIGLWFFSQLDPSLPLFGIVFFSDGVQAQLAGLAANAMSKILGPLSVSLNLISVGLTLRLIMRSSQATLAAVALIVWVAALIKLIAAMVLLRTEAAFLWVSQEVAWAIVGGALGVAVASALPRRSVQAACAAALIGAILLSLLRPGDSVPFLSLRLFRWSYMQLLHYTGLSAAVAEIWPYVALGFVVLLWRNDRRKAAANRPEGI
jgi:VanZ family protein